MNPEAISNTAAEWSVVANMISEPKIIAEVVGTQIEADDFLTADARALYSTTVESYYADKPVEPLSIAERVRRLLSAEWRVREQDVAQELLERLGRRDFSHGVMEHAAIVKSLSTRRKLLSVANRAVVKIAEGDLTPEEIAGIMSAEALGVTSGTLSRSELMGWMDTGTEYAKYLRRLRLAREKGIELAVYTGFPFIDNYTRGIAPTELCFIAGAPGVGKSVLGWRSAEGFASRQMTKIPEHRVGTLIVSMEMGLVASSTRLAQSITRLDGVRLREGDIDDREYNYLLREWKARDGLPIYFNYASNFRLSQLRALIVEAIRRYNVGFVVLDHFRQIDPDRRVDNPNEADEIKVRFLKENIAKDLNVAVLCLAHTIKIGRSSEGNARPRLADLRGSGQIAAHADFVAFMHKPGKNASEEEQLELHIKDTDAEMLWEKDRHVGEGAAYFTFEPATMTLRAR